MSSEASNITINEYSVLIGHSIKSEINSFLSKKQYDKLAVLVDNNTMKSCLPVLKESLEFSNEPLIIEISAGEEFKNRTVLDTVFDQMLEHGINRNSVLVNLGGGMVTDLGGFAGATYQRGIDFIHVPTTVLGQVDAAIGGKVGINHKNIKNQIGVFADPVAVFVDAIYLQTLDDRQLRNGFAEVMKYGLIMDKTFWKEIIKKYGSNFWLEDSKTIDPELISTCIKLKAEIVQKDPLDKGIRKTLNFGHTFGHALESFYVSHGLELLHGEAVAAGIIVEGWLSQKLLELGDVDFSEIVDQVNNVFPTLEIAELDPDSLIDLMRHDKKNFNNEINFTLLQTLGDAKVDNHVDVELITEAIEFLKKL